MSPVEVLVVLKVYNSADSDQLDCKVKLSGTNVFEGVRESVKQGMVTRPLPPTLTGMMSAASNHVSVALSNS